MSSKCELYEPIKFDPENKPMFREWEQLIFDIKKARLSLMGTLGIKDFDNRHESKFIKYCDKKFHYRSNGIDVETIFAKCPLFTGKIINEKVEEVKQEVKKIMTFDNYIGKTDIIDFMRGFMGNFDINTLILIGSVGTGKSHLARSIQINEIEKGKSVEFIASEELNKIFMEYETWNDDRLGKLEAKKKYNNMLNSQLLIIDDMGAEKISKTDHFSTQLLILLDKMKGKLVVTTNLMVIKPDEFKKIDNENTRKYLNVRYNERIVSRILEKAKSIKLSGKDWRLKKDNQEGLK